MLSSSISKRGLCESLLFLLQFQALVSVIESRKLLGSFNTSPAAILVFGDSTVDPGNNNFVATAFRSNFRPYGLNFPGRIPTGRFTDGRLVTDFIASYMGIKENVPPYLDAKLKLEDLKTGVSFASAGSGLDPLTSSLLDKYQAFKLLKKRTSCRFTGKTRGNFVNSDVTILPEDLPEGVISMQKQLEYFKEYKRKLEIAIGKEKTETLLSKTVFIISVGINDIAISYYLTGIQKIKYDINGYQQLLLQILQQFIQDIREEGARVVSVVGQPPIGCIPVVITVTTDDDGSRSCNEQLSSVGFDFNQKLKKMLYKMNDSKFRVTYADIYNPILDMLKNPSKFGFDKVDVACCGSGLIEMSFLCNSKSTICENPNKYMFFDSAHASEATYKYVFEALRPTIDQAININ